MPTTSSPASPSSAAQADSAPGKSVRHTLRPSTTPATSVLSLIPPARASASRLAGPDTKSSPIACTGLAASTGSAAPISPKYVATSSRGRSASAPSRW